MPRFYFHLEDGELSPDLDGTALASVQEAQREAVEHFAEMMRERCAEIWRDRGLKLTVVDERGLTLFVLEMTATIAPAVSAPPRH